MKKMLKILLWILAALATLVVAALLALPLWIGLVVPPTASAVVPQKTGTPFQLGAFSFNPYVGRMVVRDLALMNPEGCEQKIAFSLGSLELEVEPATVLADTVVVRRLAVKDVFVSLVKTPTGQGNWKAIQEHAAGGAERKPAQPEPQTSKASSRKFIVDELVIDGVVLEWGKMTLPIRIPVRLTGIGRKTGGVDWNGLWTEVRDAVLKSLGSLGSGLKGLGSSLGGNLDAGLEAVLEKASSGGAAGSEKVQRAALLLKGLLGK